MAREDNTALLQFLSVFPAAHQELALWLRDFVWNLYPDANELVYDAYSSVAFGWGLSDRLGDVFCSIAVYNKGINFGFNRGHEITDTEKRLSGNGNVYRYIHVPAKKDFPKKYITLLLAEAHANAVARFKPGKKIFKGETIVKSISPKKRRPA